MNCPNTYPIAFKKIQNTHSARAGPWFGSWLDRPWMPLPPRLATAAARGLRAGRSLSLGVRGMAYSVDFEVHGRVQGVFFRACAADRAKALGLVGWCMNTPEGTVKGVAQTNDRAALDQMMVWLQSEGSPSSRIDRCVFSNERNLLALEYPDFSVKRRSSNW